MTVEFPVGTIDVDKVLKLRKLSLVTALQQSVVIEELGVLRERWNGSADAVVLVTDKELAADPGIVGDDPELSVVVDFETSTRRLLEDLTYKLLHANGITDNRHAHRVLSELTAEGGPLEQEPMRRLEALVKRVRNRRTTPHLAT